MSGYNDEITKVFVGHPHAQTNRYIEVIIAQTKGVDPLALLGLLGVSLRDVWPEPVQSAIDWVKAPMSMAWGWFCTTIAVVIALTYAVTAYLLSRRTRACYCFAAS